MESAPNLFLIGPMGAGKTTVGRHLAALLGLPFHDLDREIEACTGASVFTVFDIEGEEGFRQRESRALQRLAAGDGIVLATGGGAVLREQNREILRERGFVVWLDATVDVQLARLARDRQRPLLAGSDRRERLEQLAAAREPLYAAIADLHVPSHGIGSSVRLARELAGELAKRWRQHAAHVA
jgi:shikimate kinase